MPFDSVLLSIELFRIWMVPEGKPDPLENKPIEGKDTRRRVMTLNGAPKYLDTSWYLAFNLLRERYKAPNATQFKEREFEKQASALCKELSRIHAPYQQNIETAKTMSVQQQQDQYAHTAYLIGQCCRTFFKQCNIDVEEAKENPSPSVLDSINQYHSIEHLARRVIAQRYHFQPSSWTPQQSFDTLKKELQDKGPLIVLGKFAHLRYLMSPYYMEEIEGHRVRRWGSTTVCEKHDGTSYTVILVCVEQTRDEKRVYFINPLDPSDPNGSKRQLYGISYKELKQCVYGWNGLKQGHASSDEEGYAVYYEKGTQLDGKHRRGILW